MTDSRAEKERFASKWRDQVGVSDFFLQIKKIKFLGSEGKSK